MGVLVLFDEQGRWGDTHVCDSLIAQHLAPAGVAWGVQGSGTVDGSADAVRLFYLEVDAGFVAVLCEPGERIGPLRGAVEAPWLREASMVPPGLPAVDEFIETMLALTGHASEEDGA